MLAAGIVLAVILMIGFIRMGVTLDYEDGELRLALKIAFVRLRILPKKEKKRPKRARTSELAPQPTVAQEDVEELPSLSQRLRRKTKESSFQRAFAQFSFEDIGPLLQMVQKLSGKMARGIRFDRILFLYRMAGQDDPAATALWYGRWMTVVGILLPILDEKLRIKRYTIHIAPDFNTDESALRAGLDVTLSIGRGVGLGLYALVKALGFMRSLRNKAQRPDRAYHTTGERRMSTNG